MEDYSGDSIFAYELSRDCVLVLLTKCLLTNKRLSINESGYGDYNDIVITYDGHPIDDISKEAIFKEARELAEIKIKR
jgi:hypothetical protein